LCLSIYLHCCLEERAVSLAPGWCGQRASAQSAVNTPLKVPCLPHFAASKAFAIGSETRFNSAATVRSRSSHRPFRAMRFGRRQDRGLDAGTALTPAGVAGLRTSGQVALKGCVNSFKRHFRYFVEKKRLM
jgi:hypothetical protein